MFESSLSCPPLNHAGDSATESETLPFLDTYWYLVRMRTLRPTRHCRQGHREEWHDRTVEQEDAPQSPNHWRGAASLGARPQSKAKPVTNLGRGRRRDPGLPAVRVDPLDHRTRTSSGYHRARRDPPTFMKVILVHLDRRHHRRLSGRHLLLHHQAVAAGAANHPGRHALCRLRPAVLPGSAAELLQHLEHLQHLDVEPRLVGPGHSGLGVLREAGRHDGRAVPDERARVTRSSCCARCSAAGSCAKPSSAGPTSTPSA